MITVPFLRAKPEGEERLSYDNPEVAKLWYKIVHPWEQGSWENISFHKKPFELFPMAPEIFTVLPFYVHFVIVCMLETSHVYSLIS